MMERRDNPLTVRYSLSWVDSSYCWCFEFANHKEEEYAILLPSASPISARLGMRVQGQGNDLNVHVNLPPSAT